MGRRPALPRPRRLDPKPAHHHQRGGGHRDASGTHGLTLTTSKDQNSYTTSLGLTLTTRDIDRFLAHKATTLSTATVARLLSILRRSIRRAQAQDLVRRNVALLSEVPRG